jgi:hypothetical protein
LCGDRSRDLAEVDDRDAVSVHVTVQHGERDADIEANVFERDRQAIGGSPGFGLKN